MKLLYKAEWDNLHKLMERINQLFEETFSAGKTNSAELANASFVPPMDIYETDSKIVITVEIPGIKQEDVSITIDNNKLTIKGERRLQPKIGTERYRCVERNYGSFIKPFSLPVDIVKDNIEAELKDGVLIIHLPKNFKNKGKSIEIAVKD